MSTNCECGGTCPNCRAAEGKKAFDRKALVEEKMKMMRGLSPSKRGRKEKDRSEKK